VLNSSAVKRGSIRPAVLAAATLVLLIGLYFVVARDGSNVDRGAGVSGDITTDPRSEDMQPVSRRAASGTDAAQRDVSEEPDARERAIAQIMRASESFRHSTLLVAIHDAGFVCEVVTGAMPVGDPTQGWQVKCPRAFAYSVAVTQDGTLEVLPTLNSFDNVGPVIVTPAPPIPRQ
jgi:hypothetical protein